MFDRKKAKEEVAKIPNRKKTHYAIADGDAVALTIYGTYNSVNGMVETTSGSYFTVTNFISDIDVSVTKLEPRRGKHA